MNKEQKLITLDTDYGFGIYLPNSTIKNKGTIRRTGNYAANKDNNPYMFKNNKIAYQFARLSMGLNFSEFKINVIKFNKKKHKIQTIAKFEDMQLLNNNTYQYISDDMIYYIRERYIDIVEYIQYLVFENGDTERYEKPYGPNRNKELFRQIINAAIIAFYRTGILKGIKVEDETIVISFINSTKKIHITTNSYIAKLNMARKEDTEASQYSRCLPYDKRMDKYLTFYSYVSRDNSEPEDNFGNNKADDVTAIYDYIVNYIINNDDSPLKLSQVEFKGVILTKDD